MNTLVDIGVAEGLERRTLVGLAGLTEAELARPEARVPLAAEVALWQVLARRVRDPGFAVRAALHAPLTERGLLGYVIWYSSTLRHAYRRLSRFSRILTEAVEFSFAETSQPYVAVACHRTLDAAAPFVHDYCLAAVVIAARSLTGLEIVPVEVCFAHRRSASILHHRALFRCPLRFDARQSRVVFDRRDIDLPVLKSDEQLAGYLSEYAEHVLASLIGGESTRQLVRAAIWSTLADGRPTLGRVAAMLHMPTRTLQRHLAREGTSLQAEVEEIRKTMAIATLRDHRIAVEEVAFMLGYTEPSTFFRSFRRWTGTTPQRFRVQQQ